MINDFNADSISHCPYRGNNKGTDIVTNKLIKEDTNGEEIDNNNNVRGKIDYSKAILVLICHLVMFHNKQ